MGGTIRAKLFITVCVFWPPLWSSASPFLDDWDSDFQDSAEIFLPIGTDWRLLKAQCYQESRLDPFAVSPAGASGLCQFMPGTWRDAQAALGPLAGVATIDPQASILAAGWYMGKLHRTWRAPRPAMDRYLLSLASYNAGAGHIIEAQRRCGNFSLYRSIIPCLPLVTGRHAKETTEYVEKIIGLWWPKMLYR